ncbi:PLD-like domain protein [Chlamydia ibidis]|uniref:PLD-like domain protein n=1 Tax=Chlamydia ibidis TaxID=1405396 RepID=S7KIX5_9CHLA|nr:PLD-like domain protein [Chlamydia ibidis]
MRILIFLLSFGCANHIFAYTIHCPHSKEYAAVMVYDNGREVYEQLLKFIDAAEHYVELCPCMTGGALLEEILEHLDKRLQEVEQLTSYMIIQPTLIDLQDKKLLSDMRAKWGSRFSYVFTGCPPSSNILAPNVIEMHVKLSIFDGKYIIIGGTNFEDFMCTPGDKIPEEVESSRLMIGGVKRPLAFRDQDIAVASPILGLELRKEFHAHYKLWSAYEKHLWFNKNIQDFRNDELPPLSIEEAETSYCSAFEDNNDLIFVDLSNIRVIFSGPDEQVNSITREYRRLIDEAKHDLRIAQMYFLPKEEIISGLINACYHRGVSLQVVTNGCTDRSPSITGVYAWGNRMNYFPLYYGERPPLWKKMIFYNRQPNPHVQIHEFYIPDTQFHKKCMIADDVFVIGSYNFGRKSDICDYESIMVIESPEVVRRAIKVFDKDKTLSTQVQPRDSLDWYFHPVHHVVGHLQINFMPA